MTNFLLEIETKTSDELVALVTDLNETVNKIESQSFPFIVNSGKLYIAEKSYNYLAIFTDVFKKHRHYTKLVNN